MIDLQAYKTNVIDLCEKHNVDHLYLFGSAVSGNFNAASDVDFLVLFRQMDLHNYFSNYSDLKQQLEILFKRKVDLLEEQTIKNPVLKKSIERTKVLVYG